MLNTISRITNRPDGISVELKSATDQNKIHFNQLYTDTQQMFVLLPRPIKLYALDFLSSMYDMLTAVQEYLSLIVDVSFIGGGKQSVLEKSHQLTTLTVIDNYITLGCN
jgi:hypothetical protein